LTQSKQLLDGLRDEIEKKRVSSHRNREANGSLLTGATRCSSLRSSNNSQTMLTSFGVTETDTSTYIYISHGDCHAHFAKSIRAELQAAGIKCRLDSPTGVSGQSSRQAIAKDAILQCSAFLIILSPLSAKSETLKDQLAFAENRNIPIVPILLSLQTLELSHAYTLSRSTIHHFNESIGFRQSIQNLLPQLKQLQRIPSLNPMRSISNGSGTVDTHTGSRDMFEQHATPGASMSPPHFGTSHGWDENQEWNVGMEKYIDTIVKSPASHSAF